LARDIKEKLPKVSGAKTRATYAAFTVFTMEPCRVLRAAHIKSLYINSTRFSLQ